MDDTTQPPGLDQPLVGVTMLMAAGVQVSGGKLPVLGGGVSGMVEAGRPAGALPGASLPVPIVINFPQLRLPGGRPYIFRLSVDGTTQPHWSVRITARENAPDATPS